jgi:hypothetical protein
VITTTGLAPIGEPVGPACPVEAAAEGDNTDSGGHSPERLRGDCSEN